MTVHQIADRLVELSRKMESTQAYEELFHENASSHEMPGIPGGEISGLDTLIAKSEAFDEGLTVHGVEVSEPLVYHQFFSVGMSIDVTKKDGQRLKEHEMCVYEVRDGKIISERFIYSMG
ncbi:ketosteroid isomerase-like protein [Lewinella aquimaris]|uniref:Ketosteroid isomerase-like protein n=1 Tax=Neolewinella aquimaris TaxID=1835722 RepID=A0A840E5C8_9BACT|nr:nuclear transport factor 2 family protein [Neolewinella aquimaris]MBB4078932.1 ketosteroid isomerase-like protein [Neolewinella aquimaris]